MVKGNWIWSIVKWRNGFGWRLVFLKQVTDSSLLLLELKGAIVQCLFKMSPVIWFNCLLEVGCEVAGFCFTL